MRILVTICARGGSKGIPGKNIKLLNQKPLISYSIKQGMDLLKKYHGELALSTDSGQIKKVAVQYDLSTDYTRPDELATDTAGKIGVIRDVLFYYEKKNNVRYDYIVDLDVTSPLRTLKDIEEAFNVIQKDENALNIFSVSLPKRNPYFNMVEKKENGYYRQVKDGSKFMSRQSAPQVYDMNASFYIYRRKFFDQGINSSITDFSLVYLMKHICFDLDETIDYEFMEYLVQNNKLGFNL